VAQSTPLKLGERSLKFGQWLGFFILLIALYTLWTIRQLVLLLFTAIILAIALNGLVKRFQRWGLKRGYAVLTSICVFFLALIIFFWLIIPPVLAQLPQLFTLVIKGIEQWMLWFKTSVHQLDPNWIKALPNVQELIQQLQPLINSVLQRGFIFVSGSLGVLLNLLLLLALALMLLVDPLPYRNGFIRLFPAFYRERVEAILKLCEKALEGWLIGVIFNMGIVTVLSWFCLLIIGIPLSGSQAILTGIFAFIPNLGLVLSVIPPLAIALLEGSWKPFAVLILYMIIQQIESQILTPRIKAQSVTLLPALTLSAQFFFAYFLGFLGLILAFPMIIVGQIWFKEVLIKDILDSWKEGSRE
jgi:predicted PurR-regulated permease PerM